MSQPSEQIRFCTSRDGTRIAYATCGTGPPLIWAQYWAHHLKHDWDSSVWRPWLSKLTQRHRLIRYDWRGCGLSDRQKVEFSFEKYVEDIEAVIDAAGVERFTVFGMSGGAATAMAYAVRHPERVTHLVLYGCQARGRLARSTTRKQVEEAETRLKMIEIGWPNDTPAFGQFFTSLQIPDGTAEQMRSFDDLGRLTTSPANAVGLLRGLFDYDLSEIVPKVRCATLVLQSTQGAIVPFDEGRLVASLIPGAQFVPLESRNHILLETEPAWEQLVQALDDFLPAGPASAVPVLLDELTAREREILEVVAQGLDNHDIAARLEISEKTVRNHVSIIFSKLGVSSRAQAVARARDAGIGSRQSN